MSTVTPNMNLTKWDSINDTFSHVQLGANFNAIDLHDHTTGKGVQIGAGALATNSVAAANLIDGSVTSAKILDATIATGDIANNAVTSGKILDGAVTRAKLSTGLIQTLRVTTGSVGATSVVLVTCTWPVAFANTSYTISAQVEDTLGSASNLALSVNRVESKTASQVVVTVINAAAGSRTGTLHLIGFHD